MTDLKLAQFTDVDALVNYMFAGEATLTIVSKKTQARFTYCVEESDDGKVHFVRALTGPDNVRDYQYLGHFRLGDYTHGRKSRITPDAPIAKAFDYLVACIKARRLGEHLEVWHDGRCAMCQRKLTVPESVASGIGPECAKKRGGVATPRAHMKCDEVRPF